MPTLGNTSPVLGGDQNAGNGWAWVNKSQTLADNADVYNGLAFVRTSVSTAYYKIAIWELNFTWVPFAISNQMTVSNVGPTFQWKTVTFPTNPQLTSGVKYYIGLIHNGGASGRINYQNSTGNGGYTTTVINYNGGDLTALSQTQRRMSVYVNYNIVSAGPSLLVEGITPGKLEGVDWGDINDVD